MIPYLSYFIDSSNVSSPQTASLCSLLQLPYFQFNKKHTMNSCVLPLFHGNHKCTEQNKKKREMRRKVTKCGEARATGIDKGCMPEFLFCTKTNKRTIISQIITLLHVSTLPCHPQGACNQRGWHDSVETCMSVIICEIIVHLLVLVQNNKRCTVHVLK